ncbi:cupredoxin domain-containing protein [Phanerochaete sordida]|uniref:laccase n=1 Tax=Phanerochaete sordida TaxID=48140 RepID=A0A9P3GI14_9APHY|nr:cupredoxin domain-containing protein [Phanerochaete sordida]
MLTADRYSTASGNGTATAPISMCAARFATSRPRQRRVRFTLEANKTYRLRLVHTGSSASVRFTVDSEHHTLTVVEADSTLVQPYDAAGVTLAAAQRYSVLVRTSNSTGFPFWMRAAVQSDMFTYDEPGQNLDICCVIRYGPTADASPLPVETDDPGVPSDAALQDMGTAQLAPAVVASAPAATRQYPLTIALELADSQLFLGFMNSTVRRAARSWSPLQGTTTLLQTRAAASNGSVYSADGGQFMVMEDSVQVVDLLISNLDDSNHPFHLHGHRPRTYAPFAYCTLRPLTRQAAWAPAPATTLAKP